MKLGEEQRRIIYHALGIPNSSKTPYRNYYFCPDGAPELEGLVAIGAMSRGRTTRSGIFRYYHVTEAGAEAVGFELPED